MLFLMFPDDELDLSASDPARLESPAKARRKAFEQKLRKEGIDRKVNPASADKNKLKLSVLKQQMEGQKDEETKRDDKQNKKMDRSFGTKTREQELREAKLTAQTQPTADLSVQQAKREDTAKKEAQEHEIQQESSS